MKDSGKKSGVDFAKLDEEYNRIVLQGGEKLYDGRTYHHVNSTSPDTLSEDIMLPPMASYTIRFSGRFLFTHEEGEGEEKSVHLGRENGKAVKSDYCYDMTRVENITPKDENGNEVPFLPGRKYVVNLYVYGPSEIRMEVKLNPWEEWKNPIEEGMDDEFSGEGYE